MRRKEKLQKKTNKKIDHEETHFVLVVGISIGHPWHFLRPAYKRSREEEDKETNFMVSYV